MIFIILRNNSMNTKEQLEVEFDKKFPDGYANFCGCVEGDLEGKWKKYAKKELLDFIRETREQDYQKGLDDGYDEGFRACEKGVTP